MYIYVYIRLYQGIHYASPCGPHGGRGPLRFGHRFSQAPRAAPGPTAAAVGSAICLPLLCIFLTEL